jgi:hypothetical protein
MNMNNRLHPIQPADGPRPQALAPMSHFRIAGTDERKVLRWLLSEAWRRLRQGRSMEKERNLVFPECTAISRDIERMTRRLNDLNGTAQPPDGTVELKDMLQAL